MPVDLLTLQLFIATADAGNMAKAAEAHNIAHSAVSKRIADLEYGLRVPLLVRTGRGVAVTAAGETALVHARGIMRLVERFEGAMSEFSDGRKGKVSVAACASSVVQFLPADIAAYLSRYPGVDIDLAEELSETVVRQVRDNLAEIGIVPGSLEAPGLELLPYRQDRLAVLVPADHPLAGFEQVSFEQTLDYRHIGLRQGSSIRELLLRKAQALGRSVDFSVSVQSFEAVRKMVEAGLGITLLPTASLQSNHDPQRLRVIPLSDAWSARSLCLLVRDSRALSRVARQLLNYLVSRQTEGLAERGSVSTATGSAT